MHPTRKIAVSVHGDDFTGTGPKSQLDWFQRMMRGHYELTVGGRLRAGPSDDKEATVLNRVISWTEQGVEYEADTRQVEHLLDEIEPGGEGVKGVVSPGQQPHEHQVADEKELPRQQHTRFRGLAARAPISWRPTASMPSMRRRISADSWPTPWAALKQLGRYLKARPRTLFSMYFRQCTPSMCTAIRIGRAASVLESPHLVDASCLAHT